MNLPTRDRSIVRAVARFGQLSTGHVRAVFFSGLSNTPCDRALYRLTKRKVLARIERPLAGGNRGGSGQYIYQLGPLGWKLCRGDSRYAPYRAVNYHMLAIADVFVALKHLEHEGRYQVTGYETEPDTWLTVGGVELRPDLYVELADAAARRVIQWWLEVDMGTERPKQLKEKMSRYYHAYQYADEQTMPIFPLVVFLVPDKERLQDIRWIISREPEDSRHLFTTCLRESYPQALL
ncbi:MAG: replication-relaxation family protein [Acidobacteria bacterium]|nr:replication-relaxation family protein [Acidobacteriota bacterium]